MRRSHVYWSLGGLTALLVGYAVCHAFPYEPARKPTPPTRAIPESPECDLAFPAPATKPVARTTEVKAPAAPSTTPGCCAVTFTAAAPVSKEPNVYDLLAKLEALKAKQDALDAEVRETHALLNEKFRTLQMRMAKVGAGVPMTYPAPVYQPAPVPPTTCPAPDAPAATSSYDAGPPDNPKGKKRPERGPSPAPTPPASTPKTGLSISGPIKREQPACRHSRIPSPVLQRGEAGVSSSRRHRPVMRPSRTWEVRYSGEIWCSLTRSRRRSTCSSVAEATRSASPGSCSRSRSTRKSRRKGGLSVPSRR
jgi:hypothetical protein